MSDKQIIRKAEAGDAELILTFIRELAKYEKLAHEVSATADQIKATLFSDSPAAEVLLGFIHGEPAAFALFFTNYSTFLAKPGIYLEDLFVREQYRGSGMGKAMLTEVAALAAERGCGRVEWSVLDWNEPAIGFYRRLGAEPPDDWTVWRLNGKALEALGGNRGE